MTHPTSRPDAPTEQLPELPPIVRMIRSVSREIVPDKLIDRVLAVALEHTGASRGLFVLLRDGVRRVVGEAAAVHGRATVRVPDDPVATTEVPDAVLDAVARTRERVLLHDAAVGESASSRGIRRVRSILCLPLAAQDELLGALYLEDPSPHTFTPIRVETMQLLAEQAAISLQQAHLVADLRQAEHAARQRAEELELILDGVPELIWRARPDGSIDFINRRWGDLFRMAESPPEDWDPPRFGWSAQIHPDDAAGVLAHWSKGLTLPQPYEHVFRVRGTDGQYRWHLTRGHPQLDATGAVVRWHGVMFDIQHAAKATRR